MTLTSLVLPVFNPGETIVATLEPLEAFLTRERGWEILFVCDGCSDGSPAALAEWCSRWPNVARVFGHEPNRGKGYAVREGFAQARGQWVIFTDFDLAYGLDGVCRVADALWQGASVVIGSRTHAESQVTLPIGHLPYVFFRQLQGSVFSFAAHYLLPTLPADTQAGLKGFRTSVIQSSLPRLVQNDFAFDCELLMECQRLGLPIQEVPVHLRYDRRPSTTNWRSSLSMLRSLWRIHQAALRQPAAPVAPRQAA